MNAFNAAGIRDGEAVMDEIGRKKSAIQNRKREMAGLPPEEAGAFSGWTESLITRSSASKRL